MNKQIEHRDEYIQKINEKVKVFTFEEQAYIAGYINGLSKRDNINHRAG